MAGQTLELVIVSAKDLRNVKNVYAVTSFDGNRSTRLRTVVDYLHGRNPVWSSTLRYNFPATGDIGSHILHVLLRSQRLYFPDRDVGEVYIPLKELLDGATATNGQFNIGSYQLRKKSSGNKFRGVLNIMY